MAADQRFQDRITTISAPRAMAPRTKLKLYCCDGSTGLLDVNSSEW